MVAPPLTGTPDGDDTLPVPARQSIISQVRGGQPRAGGGGDSKFGRATVDGPVDERPSQMGSIPISCANPSS